MQDKRISLKILDTLIDEGYYNPDNKFAFVGYAGGNPLAYKSEMYGMANNYAQFSSGEWNGELDLRAWKGIFNYILGIKLDYCEANEYIELLANEEVQAMPDYPVTGCIKEINGIIVVKVS